MSDNRFVTVRITGGLGNQLFQYATARRLAHVNNARLHIDTISGFQINPFKRSYSLKNFNIDVDIASSVESYSFYGGRYYRWFRRMLDSYKPLSDRIFIKENDPAFDENILHLNLKHSVYLEGLFQSGRYFKDIENIIRSDLKITSPISDKIAKMADNIEQTLNPVSIHVRRLYKLGDASNSDNPEDKAVEISLYYYRRAIKLMIDRVEKPFFYVFTDDPEWVHDNFAFLDNWLNVEKDCSGQDYEILHLMNKCKHFICSYSTFSWWGAWLNNNAETIVLYPEDVRHNIFDIMHDNWTCVPE